MSLTVPQQPKTDHELRRAFQRLAVASKTSYAPPLVQDGQSVALEVDPNSGLAVVSGELKAETFIYPAGEIFTSNTVLYRANGTVYKADAASTPIDAVVGVAGQSANGIGVLIPVITRGLAIGLVGLTPDARYFLGTAGALTTTPPASGLCQLIGIAVSATVLAVDLGVPLMR